MMSSTWW